MRINGGGCGVPCRALGRSHTANSEDILPIRVNSQRHYASLLFSTGQSGHFQITTVPSGHFQITTGQSVHFQITTGSASELLFTLIKKITSKSQLG